MRYPAEFVKTKMTFHKRNRVMGVPDISGNTQLHVIFHLSNSILGLKITKTMRLHKHLSAKLICIIVTLLLCKY